MPYAHTKKLMSSTLIDKTLKFNGKFYRQFTSSEIINNYRKYKEM